MFEQLETPRRSELNGSKTSIFKFALLGILFAEEDKIRYALAYPDVTPEELAELADVDKSVAKVLEEVCCIEKQVIKKLELGIFLRNGGLPC